VSTDSVSFIAAGDLPAIGAYFAQLLPVFNALTPDLQALGTPPSDPSDWSSALAAFQTTVNDWQNALTAAQGGNLSAYDTAIAQEATDNQQVVTDFNNFGATVCAGGTSSSPSPSASTTPTPS
jgi:hypothetical protein